VRNTTVQRSLSAVATIIVATGLVIGGSQVHVSGAPTFFVGLAAIATFVAAAYIMWNVEPTYILCAALFLSPISGSWQQLGIPGYAAPDRLLLIAGIAAIVIRAPGAADRPTLRIAPAHRIMLVTVLYAAASALVAGTLTHKSSFFKLFEAFGILPFALFLVAPVAFRTSRQRDVLLRTFIALGAWLGLTTIFEYVHLDALVWPKYILDPNYGIHAGRGRGPFVEAVTNGYALYVCAVACAVAAWRWRARRSHVIVATAVALISIAGTVMCLERSAWLGAVLGTIVAGAAARDARRFLPVVVATLVVVVAASVVVVPGLRDKVTQRSNDKGTIWDRKNLNRAAFNMIEARPLVGFGWDEFLEHDQDYFQQAADYPLTNVSTTNIHNSALTYAVGLGLIGVLMWLACLLTGVGGALASRGPPDLYPWRIALLAVATSYLVVTNFTPPSVFPNFSLWLFAAVAWSGRYAEHEGDAADGSGVQNRPPRNAQAANP
jgi:putative inorganic carbon (HCO3(-)) transporter